jgi:hypothetical protein
LGVSDQSIAKHHYTELLFKLAIGLVITGGCSLRSTVKTIKFLNELLDCNLPAIPCFRTVRNWLEKAVTRFKRNPIPTNFPKIMLVLLMKGNYSVVGFNCLGKGV